MTLSASGAQESQLTSRVNATRTPAYSILRDRMAPLEIVTPRRRTLLTNIETGPPVARRTSEDAEATINHTTKLTSDDGYVKMESHVDYYYQNLEVWGVRAWIRAWIPTGTTQGCNRPQGCRLIVVAQEYTMDLKVPETTFQLDNTAIIPVPQGGAYASGSGRAIWIPVPQTPLAHTSYLKHSYSLLGITIAACVIGDNMQSNSRIHAHGAWPGGPAYVTSFVAPK